MENKIAVLIDGDNANAKHIESILTKIKEYGEVVIKRVYGDWSQSQLSSWKAVANKNSIKAIQAFSYIKGKNSTDIALIIDAMDIIHSKRINVFCIVSSDCDFTGLVHRIKEDGHFAIGVGKENSCISFKQACDQFISDIIKDTSIEKAITAEKNESKELEKVTLKVVAEKLPGLTVIGKIDLNKIKN